MLLGLEVALNRPTEDDVQTGKAVLGSAILITFGRGSLVMSAASCCSELEPEPQCVRAP